MLLLCSRIFAVIRWYVLGGSGLLLCEEGACAWDLSRGTSASGIDWRGKALF